MGLSSSKTVQSNDPWGPAQPAILKGLNAATSTYDANQPTLQKYASQEQDTYGRVAPGALQGVNASQNLANRTINGDFLKGNPYVQGMLNTTNANITNGVNGQFEGAGRYGSGMHAKILADSIGSADNAMLYGNYSAERQNQLAEQGQASSLMAGSQSLLNNAADLPWVGVAGINGNVRQASNGYGTSTQTSNPGFGQMLMGAAMGGLNAYASNPAAFSDRRLKTNVVKIGEADELGIYEWTYRKDTGLDLPEGRYRGVMADEVAKVAPELLGPPMMGFQTVHYTPERVG